MSVRHITRGVIFIHPVPSVIRPHVEWAMSSVLRYDVRFEWIVQPTSPSMSRAEASWVGDVGAGTMLASALGGWEYLRFEVTENGTAVDEGRRWSATPGLGISYARANPMGNVVVPENRIRAAVDRAGGDAHEIHRLLSLALGQTWGDELEPSRYTGAGAPVQWLRRVGRSLVHGACDDLP